MKIYHGSKKIIDRPLFQGSKKDNDYGPAFYLTRDIESAHEWACRNNTIGYVNEYSFRLDALKVLDLTDKSKFTVLNWLAIILHFRTLDSGFKNSFSNRLNFLEQHFYVDVTQYDVVIGYRADDAYFRFPLDFVRGNLTLEQLEYSFNLGKLGVQYCLISDRAIKRLKFVGATKSNERYIQKYFASVVRATESFDKLNKDEDGVHIIDLMRNKEK